MPTVYCALCGEDMKSDEAYKSGRSFFKQTYHMCALCLAYSDNLEQPWISDLDKDTGNDKVRLLLAESFIKRKEETKAEKK